MAEKVELSQEALGGYAKKALDVVGDYSWNISKYGVGLGISGWGLDKGYNFLAGLPILKDVDRLAHQFENAPVVIGTAAAILAAWKGKEVVDRWIAKNAP